MSELEALFESLVAAPPAAPPPMEELRSRVRRRRARRAILGAGVVATALAATGVGVVVQSDPSSSTVQVGGGAARVAEYRSTTAAGYRASGAWRLVIERPGHTVVLEAPTAPSCAETPVIEPGDTVRAEILNDTSTVVTGPDVDCD